MKRFIAFFIAIAVLCADLSAQQLLSPDAFLPHHLGEQFTTHAQLVSYCEHVAAVRPLNVKKFVFGTTTEERPQLLMAVSSAENIANLDKIRLDNLRRVGFEAGIADNTNPVAFVWLGYSVHGNEPAGSEASMKVLYELAAADRPAVQSWLKNTVVLIDPSENPDGFDRYVQWYRQVSGKLVNTGKNTMEHEEPWPGGRVNHYLFDLNRDWAWATQTETQNRIKMYKKWMPHVHPDIHEMGYNNPYFFAPAAEPFHKFVSTFQKQFQIEVGKNHARYFDQNGWLYYTKEVFDLLYPSYGDTYPTFNGAIGMTYEQGGIGAGRAIVTENSDTLTLQDRIEHHYTTSMSTIEVTSRNARKLVGNFEAYFKSRSTQPPGNFKSYVIKSSSDHSKLEKLIRLLDLHKIQYGSGTKMSAVSGFNYTTQRTETFDITEKDLVVNAAQPMATLAQVLFEPVTEIPDSLTYDITSWAIPYSWGLDAYACKQSITSAGAFDINRGAASKSETVPYAFVFKWKSVNDVRFLSKLTQMGMVVRKAGAPFVSEGREFDSGTLIVARADNRNIGANWAEIIRNLAVAEQQEIYELSSGWADRGSDLGSSKVKIVATPRVLICGGDGVDNCAFGQVWNFFDTEIEYVVSTTTLDRLKSIPLEQFDLIILPDGNYAFEGAFYDKIKHWVISGGRLVLLERAISAFEDQKGFSISKFADKKEKDAAVELSEKEQKAARLDGYAESERKSISSTIPGAVFRLRMDNTHPLAYGLPEYYFSLKTNTLYFSYLKDGYNVGRLEGDAPIIGFAGSKIKDKLNNTLVFGVQPLGRGNVTYLTDNPLFRGFWEQGKLIFGNAVFMNAD